MQMLRPTADFDEAFRALFVEVPDEQPVTT